MASPLPRDIRLQCEMKAWELRREFWTQSRIAKELGITQQAVSRMLARVERRELARFHKRVERTKARQTAQLETIASEAFDAWLHSKTPQVIEKTTTDDDQTSKTVESRTHQCDASLLGQARGALADIRAIWGLDSPTKTEVSGTVKEYHVANTPDGL
jgi:predicted transcriptional regulator